MNIVDFFKNLLNSLVVLHREIVVLVQTVILPVMNSSCLYIVPISRFTSWKRQDR